MKRNPTITLSLAFGALALIGCGGSGGGSGSQAPFASGIYIVDTSAESVEHVSDMAGAGYDEKVFGSNTMGMAFAPDGSMVVVDQDHGRLLRWKSPSSGSFDVFGTVGSGTNQLNIPKEIAFDSLGRIYIADVNNFRIVCMDNFSGAGWTTIDTSAISNSSYEEVNICTDAQNRIYALYPTSGKIVRWDDMADAQPETFGPNGFFSNPSDMHVDASGNIYVVDRGHNRIVKLLGMTGNGYSTIGSSGSGVGEFDQPKAMAIGTDGKLYINDRDNGRLVRINDMTGAGWTEMPYSVSPGLLAGSPEDIVIR